MLLDLVARRDVLFLGGKGGVGKTSVAAAIAVHEASRGRRVHLVSTDPAHNLGHLFGTSLGDGATRVADNLTATEIDPVATTHEHLAAVEATMRRLMPEHLHGEIRSYLRGARTAPGMHEAAILERMAQLAANEDASFDLVVFDTAPSGHTARLMTLPETMGMWTESLLRRHERSRKLGDALAALDDDGPAAVIGSRHAGGAPGEFGSGGSLSGRAARRERDHEIRHLLLRRRDRFERFRSIITAEESTAFVIVLAAERLPVAETIEFHTELSGHGIPVEALVVNKLSPPEGGELLASRHRHEQEHLAVLARELPGVPITRVPLLADEVVGLPALADFARRLA